MSAQKCWVVTWMTDYPPHDQWHGDRHWPFVEVYESWGDAFTKLGQLRDLGHPATFWETGIHPSSAAGAEPQEAGQ